MPKIFISYRREDSQDITGRIYDRLDFRFGRENLFFDVDTIPFGVDFRKHLDQAVGQCDVLLAIIGEGWLDVCFQAGPKQGLRRLDDPADFVRIEIESALARGIPVIPVLVGRATMPGDQDLPEGLLRQLAFRNAAEVRSGRDFRDHVDRLIRGIEFLLAGRQQAQQPATPPEQGSEDTGKVLNLAGRAGKGDWLQDGQTTSFSYEFRAGGRVIYRSSSETLVGVWMQNGQRVSIQIGASSESGSIDGNRLVLRCETEGVEQGVATVTFREPLAVPPGTTLKVSGRLGRGEWHVSGNITFFTYVFQPGGELVYSSSTGEKLTGTWVQEGNRVGIVVGGSSESGTIAGNRLTLGVDNAGKESLAIVTFDD
jgi:hypothetical protein